MARSDEDDVPSSVLEESFENALPVPELPPLGAEPAPADQPPPSLEVAIQRIPANTRQVLDELFKVKFTTVRRIKPEQMR